jgi:hypothetical protein
VICEVATLICFDVQGETGSHGCTTSTPMGKDDVPVTAKRMKSHFISNASLKLHPDGDRIGVVAGAYNLSAVDAPVNR